jgi:hypothetical protein
VNEIAQFRAPRDPDADNETAQFRAFLQYPAARARTHTHPNHKDCTVAVQVETSSETVGGVDQLFCNLALFGFFSYIYAPGSFISKNGPLARRRHHWRRACVCRRQYYWRLYVRRRCDLD